MNIFCKKTCFLQYAVWRQKICRWVHHQDCRQKPKEKEKVLVVLAVWRVAPYNLVAGCLSGFHRQGSVKIDFICMQTVRSLSIKARVVFQKISSFSVYVLCLMFYVLHPQQVRWHRIRNKPAFMYSIWGGFEPISTSFLLQPPTFLFYSMLLFDKKKNCFFLRFAVAY